MALSAAAMGVLLVFLRRLPFAGLRFLGWPGQALRLVILVASGSVAYLALYAAATDTVSKVVLRTRRR
jgi:hypothetical protein